MTPANGSDGKTGGAIVVEQVPDENLSGGRTRIPTRIVSLMKRIEDFYRTNPGTLLRARDLCYIVGGDVKEITTACEHLKEKGFLAATASAANRSYRLKRG